MPGFFSFQLDSELARRYLVLMTNNTTTRSTMTNNTTTRSTETMSTAEAERLIVEGFATKFCAFVNLCEADCYVIDLTRDAALAMVRRAAELGDTVLAFHNESSGTLCIG